MPKKIEVPEPEAGLSFIDVHCHLPFPRPKRDDKLPTDKEQYDDFFEKGGLYLISCSIDIQTLKLLLKFRKQHPDKFGFTCGWAPQTVTYTPKDKYDREWREWVDYVQNNSDELLAIGEIGFDFHHAKTLEKRERQVEEFKKVLELTRNFNKPFVLHVRNAAPNEVDKQNPNHRYNDLDGANKELIRILKEFKIDSRKVMWHCFSGPDEYGTTLPKEGFLLSVPSSAYGFQRWQRVTKESPIENLVTETDSYYQHPFLRGPVNVPTNVKYSIAAIAHTHGLSQEEVSKKTIENAIKFFSLPIKGD